MKRRLEYIVDGASGYFRAHVWTDQGYSSRTFLTRIEAETWTPRNTAGGKNDA